MYPFSLSGGIAIEINYRAKTLKIVNIGLNSLKFSQSSSHKNRASISREIRDQWKGPPVSA